MANGRRQFWRYVRGLAAPVLLWSVFVIVLIKPLQSWLQGEERHDEATIKEWIEETRVFRDTLPEMARDFLKEVDEARVEAAKNAQPIKAEKPQDYLEKLEESRDREKKFQLWVKRGAIQEHLQSMGNLPKIYSGQLPDFPVIYRLEVSLEVEHGLPPLAIVWDSQLTRHPSQYRELEHQIDDRAKLKVQYQLHAYNKQQKNEQAAAQRFRWVAVLAVSGAVVALVWLFLVQQRERERERQRILTQQQIDQAEHRRLEEELRRREVEQRHEETERKLLEQRLATQAAERHALELKSQLYASIGIMAGSYAHNIKNLLVRPNDLLRRCLEVDGLSPDQ